MLDRYTLKLIKSPLQTTAKVLVKFQVKADHITVAGFFIGMLAIPAIAFSFYWLGFLLIILNRLFDGLDGEVARQTTATDRGAYLDIVLDFVFYSAIIFAFALADPTENALAAAALIFSFMGTGSSFLAFAILAERRSISSMVYPSKGFYYLNGLAEGTETIAVLLLMCLLPSWFNLIAWTFFAVCIATTVTRVIGGAYSLKQHPEDDTDGTLRDEQKSN